MLCDYICLKVGLGNVVLTAYLLSIFLLYFFFSKQKIMNVSNSP